MPGVDISNNAALRDLMEAGSAAAQAAMKARTTTGNVAIERGAEVISADRAFARFAGVRWRHPFS
jgi:predicted nucleic acid-binding protein